MKRRILIRLTDALEKLYEGEEVPPPPEPHPINSYLYSFEMAFSDEFPRLPHDTLNHYFDHRARHPQTPVPFEY